MKKIDKRESIRVVTSNQFIVAKGLNEVSLKARKLLYIAIAQCKLADKEFYEFSISALEFAELMNILPSHVYEEINAITDELLKTFISIIPKGQKKFVKYPLFALCSYDNGEIKFELNKKMTDFLLELKGSFTKPLLHDFLKMRSPYSMAIWHLMQREMKSRKPYSDKFFEFNLTLEELRQVTGTENKLKQISEFKNKVLDKALREIKENCSVSITYENIKTGRTVTGFHFIAKSPYYMDMSDLSLETQERLWKNKNERGIQYK